MAETQDITPQSPWNWMQPQDQGMQNYANLQKKAALVAQQQQQMAQQGILGNLNMAKAYNEVPVQTDLSPLMALADAWNPGQNMSKSYTKPQTAQERMGLLAGLQKEVDKNSQNLSEDQQRLLRTQLETQMRKEEREMQLETLKGNKEMTRAIQGQVRGDKLAEQQNKHLETAQKGWQNDTIATDAQKKLNAISSLNDELDGAKDNPALFQGLVLGRVKQEVPGRFNETEIKMMGLNNMGDFQTRLEQTFQAAKNGTLSDADYIFLKKANEVKMATQQQALQDRVALHAKQYSRISGKPEEDALYDLTGGTFDPGILHPQPKASKSSGGSGPYNVGDILPGEGGKQYKYKGGDPKDQNNYEEVK